ncbi:MAG: sigma-70 family RNA polymerase sigma factor [Myxococcota bacterium]
MPQPNANFPSQLAGEARELRSLAQRLVRSSDADDLTQDAFVTALSQPSKPRSLRPWLRQVLRNQYRASARQDHRRRAREQSSWVPEPASSPDDVAVKAQLVVAMNEVLLELDAPYREVLHERFFAERSAVDIANSEGCPAGTVRWRVQEGLRRVRRKLDERFDGRRQWLGGMAIIAGIPLPPPAAAATPGGSTMTKLTILKVLAATAVVAGGGAVALHDSPQGVEQEQAEAREYHASMQTAAASPAPKFDEPEVKAVALAEARAAAAAEPTEEEEPTCPTCALGEAGPEGTHVRMQTRDEGMAECFDGVEIKAGEFVDINLDLTEDFPGKYGVEAAEFVEARFNEIEGLQQCVVSAMDDIVLSDLPPDTHRVMISLLAGEHEPGDAPIKFGNGRGNVVDADAEDPELIAKKFGLDPRGSDDPVVSIVECTDYDCPFCKKARATVDKIVADYGDKVAVYELQNPLPFHKGAGPAARAVVAAGKQGKLWEMSDLIFDDQTRRSDEDFKSFASELGIDVAQFERDYQSDETAAAVEEQKKTCMGNGGRGTPSFFINGDILVGAQPYAKFKAIIDDELASSK